VSSPCNFRSESLLVAFYLLTSAVTAYAECAWVFREVTYRYAAEREGFELL